MMSSFTEIYPYMFYNVDSFSGAYVFLTDVTTDNITSIGDYAFNYCSILALTALSNTITSIGNFAFNYCSILALTSLPSSLTSIGNSAFYFCSVLAITFLPSGLISIGSNAFRRCTFLSRMWIPATCITIPTPGVSSAPFYQCTSTPAIYCEAASKPDGWGEYWDNYGSSTKLTVNWGVTKEAFDAL